MISTAFSKAILSHLKPMKSKASMLQEGSLVKLSLQGSSLVWPTGRSLTRFYTSLSSPMAPRLITKQRMNNQNSHRQSPNNHHCCRDRVYVLVEATEAGSPSRKPMMAPPKTYLLLLILNWSNSSTVLMPWRLQLYQEPKSSFVRSKSKG